MAKSKKNIQNIPDAIHEEVGRTAGFREVTCEMLYTYRRQNRDYGNAYIEARRKIPCYIAGKLYDKVSRLVALSCGGRVAKVSDETIDDTLLHLTICAVIELVERRIDRTGIIPF